MALQVWLPLIGDLTNQGLAGDLKFSSIGTISWLDNGKIGKCVQIGNGSQVTNGININSNLVEELGTEFSVSVWVKPLGNHVHYNGTIISSGNWNTNLGRWAFGLSQDNSKVDVFSYNYNRWINCPVPVGQWTHLVSTQKNKICKLYKNGEYVGSYTAEYDCLYSNATNTTIGRETYAGGYFSFNGCLNDLRIYNHCLSAKEIEELSKGLVMHYKLDSKFEQPIVKNLIKNLVSGGQTTISNNTKIITSGINKDTYFQFDITEGLVEGEKYTIQCDVSSPLDNDIMVWQFGVTGQSTGINMPMYNGHNEFTWVCPTAAAGKTRIMMDDNGGRARANTAVTEIYNFQIEKSDHAGALIPFNSIYENDQILDSSGYLRHGTIKDNSLNFIFDSKRYSQCMQNNVEANSTIYPFIVECNIPDSNALTFSWWMKPTQWGKQSSGIFSTSDNIYATDYQATAANMRDSHFDCTNTAGTCKRIQASDVVTLNEWHHYVLKYDGEYLSLYKDGKIFKSGTNERKVVQTGELKGFKYFIPFYSKAGGANRAMSGSLSDFRIYVTALSDEQIEELYNVSVAIDNNGNIYPRELVEK